MISALFILIPAVLASTGDAAATAHRAEQTGCARAPVVLDATQRTSVDASLVWLFLADKGVRTPAQRRAALEAVARSYEPRAVRRRMQRRTSPGLFDERDIPVCPAYVAAIDATGTRRRVESRWLNAVSVRASASQIAALARLPFVRSIAPVRRGVRAEAVPLAERAPADPPIGAGFYGLAEEQLRQIGVIDLHAAGYTGAGVVVGVLDTGFKRTHEAYNEPGHELRVLAEYDFVSDDPNTAPEQGDDPDQHFHGTVVLGAIAAYKPDRLVGGAFDAEFILAKTEDVTQEVPAEEDQYVAGLEFIESHGGDVATSSLGYIQWYRPDDMNGRTAVTTIAVNTATDNGLFCVTAAGNRGQDGDGNTLMAPGDAFLVVTCGSVDALGRTSDFSSRGPTADGRVKPEVMARGESTFTVGANADDQYAGFNGTSMSTPLVASAVALLVQAHPDWKVRHVRRALFESADYYLAHGTYDPESIRGYGVINVFAASRLFVLGDLDCDGLVAAADIEPFLVALFDPGAYDDRYPDCDARNADLNGDGATNAGDIEGFVAALFGL